MASARTHCPECRSAAVVDLQDLLYSAGADFFRCRACGCWWKVPKGQDEPVTRIALGNSGSESSEKAS